MALGIFVDSGLSIEKGKTRRLVPRMRTMARRAHRAPGNIARLLAAAVVAGLAGPAIASPTIAPTEHLTPEQEKAKFHLPPGFEVQLVASEPAIAKPMNIAFDARGRLWVTDTVEYPIPAPPGQTARDTVKILEGFAADGKAQKITTFADGLNLPLGVLPLTDGRNGAIVYGIPDVKLLLDKDGDGKADRRDVLLSGYMHDDTHGMSNNFLRGFDGWVYANYGFRNDSTVRGSDGSSAHMVSGHTYRFHTDGTHMEIFTHGQVNPFGLAFDPLGNLYSADCHTRPQMMLLRGGYYQSFGRPDDGLGFAPEMCDHDHGSTAISGTTYYAAEQWPAEFRGNLFNGNVVTNCIDRDRIVWHGSSPKAIEQPGLLVSDDPWFRPVQVKLGPDGAVYVADFYNRIIGHYEVDLKHPGRDRTSGRIWRIVYRGPDGKTTLPPVPDFTARSAEQLVTVLADPNIAVRMLATDRLADELKGAAAEPLHNAVAHPANAFQKVHAMWALHRIGGLSDEEMQAATKDADRSVRVHAMKILAEMPQWTEAARASASAGLKDADPFVQRAAADAMGLHPVAAAVRPLLDLLAAAPADDLQLRHTIRMALRDQLLPAGNLAKVMQGTLSDKDQSAIADVLPGVPSAEAASILVRRLSTAEVDQDSAARTLKYAARYVSPQDVDAVAGIVRTRFAGDVDLQFMLFQSVREGLAQKGAEAGPAVREWGTALASSVLAKAAPQAALSQGWSSFTAATPDRREDPWGAETRKAQDGKSIACLSSLTRGESYTGVLRSNPFATPETLTLYICGHDAKPGTKPITRNGLQLKDATSHEVLAEAFAPRSDVAQKVSWDLKKFAGRQAYLEASDTSQDDAYAWIAFGGLEPAVAPMPQSAGMPAELKRRQEAAVEIAASLKLAALRDPVAALLASAGADSTVRAAAARALVVLDPVAAINPLTEMVSDSNAPQAVRDAAATSLGGINSETAHASLVNALRLAPQNGQKAIAVALASTPAGADLLLNVVSTGKASPRLLQDKAILARLAASKPPELEARVAALTKGMVSADDAVQKLIDQRVAAFNPAKASAERGKLVFQKNCAACHRIGNEGATVGPQLDGAGKRGQGRLVEDILDPSRNVDGAFRVSTLQLADGDVQAGLFRREEGQTLVFADSTGKEFSLAKAQVTKRVESQLSLMPGNFGEIIPPADLNDLIAYLLSK